MCVGCGYVYRVGGGPNSCSVCVAMCVGCGYVCRVSAMCIEWEAVLTHAVFVCRVWLCV